MSRAAEGGEGKGRRAWLGEKEMVVTVTSMGGKDVPSSIPRPDLRMGTRDIDSGPIVVVVYSYPIGVFSYSNH
jgi:hypothetical protein